MTQPRHRLSIFIVRHFIEIPNSSDGMIHEIMTRIRSTTGVLAGVLWELRTHTYACHDHDPDRAMYSALPFARAHQCAWKDVHGYGCTDPVLYRHEGRRLQIESTTERKQNVQAIRIRKSNSTGLAIWSIVPCFLGNHMHAQTDIALSARQLSASPLVRLRQ